MEQIVQLKIISNNNRLLAFIFLTAILILLLIGLSIILPSAEIILQVRREPFIGDFQVKIDHSIQKPFYNLNLIPGSIYSLHNMQRIKNNNEYLVIKDTAAGQEGEIVILRRDLDDFLNQKLINSGPVPKVIINKTTQLIDSKIESFDFKNGQATITFSIKTEVIPDYNIKFLKEFLSDKSKMAAISYLKSLPNVQDVKINSRLVFFNKLPLLSRRIKIKVDPLEQF